MVQLEYFCLIKVIIKPINAWLKTPFKLEQKIIPRNWLSPLKKHRVIPRTKLQVRFMTVSLLSLIDHNDSVVVQSFGCAAKDVSYLLTNFME